ncbi:MAG: O-antigen ligase family protein [Rivularia sp. (in: cyanobacteria)]
MNHTLNTTPKKRFSFGLEPPLGWTAILAFVLFTAVCIFSGATAILRNGYIAVSFAVGLFLYLRYPILYIGFTWWLWFITPFVTRIVDLKSGFDPSRFMLVSQYLVTLLTLHTFLVYLPKSLRQGGLPFVMAFLGVFYGALIGLIKTAPMTVARGIFAWLTPVVFAFFLFIKWREYPQYRQVLQRTFIWGTLIMGAYGVWQFIVAPEWDVFWLVETELKSMGNPEPLGLRVWSTMSSPAPFSAVMMAGLLLLLTHAHYLNIPATAVGYLSFLLTSVRTLWGAWLVGLVTLFGSLKAQSQMRLIVVIVLMMLCIVPLTTIEPFSETITERFETFGELEKDDSAQVRQKIYEDGLNKALTNGFGNGVGNTFTLNEQGILEPIVIDSGFLDTFFTLGWFGAVFYLGGMLLLVYQVFQFTESRFDSFMAASRGIGIAMISTLAGNSGMLEVAGMVLWGFLAMALAGHNYHVHEQNSFSNYQLRVREEFEIRDKE